MDAIQLKCPNCGGEVTFQPGSQNFECPYCLSKFTEAEVNSFNGQSTNTPAGNSGVADNTMQADFNAHSNLYVCNSCGAQIITDENTAASFCYYCHNPVALSGRLTGQYRPGKIIPFKHTKEQALGIYKEWCRKKWFLPSDWLSESQLEKVTGLYVPFWLADSKVRAYFHGEGNISHSHVSGDYRITTTEVFNVVREAQMEYCRMPADGSQKLDDRLMDAIEPFNYADLIDFNSAYLSGFYADKYDVNKDAVLGRIYDRVNTGAQQMLRENTGRYSSINTINQNTMLTKVDWEYALLPVWFMTYDHGGKKYFFAMNGQTGKIAGILPVSVPKLMALFAGLFVGVGIIAGLIGGLML